MYGTLPGTVRYLFPLSLALLKRLDRLETALVLGVYFDRLF